MQHDIEKVLISQKAIEQRVEELARRITADLLALPHEVSPQVTLIAILTGSIVFVADLVRQLPLRLQIQVISISSYPGTATSSHGAAVQEALTRIPPSLAGRHVLLVDDILDSGNTLRAAQALITQREPASLRTCVLLRKDRPEAQSVAVDYVAFDIPDVFVVGYGLDHDDYYRNLPEIVTLRSHVLQQEPTPSRNGT